MALKPKNALELEPAITFYGAGFSNPHEDTEPKEVVGYYILNQTVRGNRKVPVDIGSVTVKDEEPGATTLHVRFPVKHFPVHREVEEPVVIDDPEVLADETRLFVRAAALAIYEYATSENDIEG